ncbi:hypothetical protein NOCARDAX2BIS_400187 [Nocardioides sp. AX2bis]|nr:hypothetical protein NOCARDAX2BIS_400187 [Nocardioides sp. AX2bis]
MRAVPRRRARPARAAPAGGGRARLLRLGRRADRAGSGRQRRTPAAAAVRPRRRGRPAVPARRDRPAGPARLLPPEPAEHLHRPAHRADARRGARPGSRPGMILARPRAPTGRGNRLKSGQFWVRVPAGAPRRTTSAPEPSSRGAASVISAVRERHLGGGGVWEHRGRPAR